MTTAAAKVGGIGKIDAQHRNPNDRRRGNWLRPPTEVNQKMARRG